MSNPEASALRFDAIPESVFTAKVEQARTKANPAGWLRNALAGNLTDPTQLPHHHPNAHHRPPSTLEPQPDTSTGWPSMGSL